MDLLTQSPIRLNLGAGKTKLDGYIAVDLNPAADVVTNIKQLPFQDGSADEILAVHVLEHLYRWEVPAVLSEWLRVLKPGGVIALELPNILKVAHFILNSPDQRLGLWGAYGDPVYEEPLMVHRWGWSPAELSATLKEAGFTHVREKPVRFHKPIRDMRLEARKP